MLEVLTADPSLKMDEDDELSICPQHRAAGQEKFHTQTAAAKEGKGEAEFLFLILSSISIHPVMPTDGKYWWCTHVCKIIYVVKHLLEHTALGGHMSQSYALSAAILLTKMWYFVFYFYDGPLRHRTNPGCSM